MLEMVFYGNSLLQYIEVLAIALAVFVGAKVVYWLFKHVAKVATAKTKTEFDDELVDKAEEPIVALIVVAGAYYAITRLTLNGAIVHVNNLAYISTALVLTWLAVRLTGVFVNFLLKPITLRTKTTLDDRMIPILATILKVVIVLFALALVLSHFNYDVSTIVASLGIGGIAVAFALQNILSDIFASFSILFDKPFSEGDFIVVGEESGTVKKIGIKSTRLQTLTGEELIISNRQLVDSRIHNYKKMSKRRVVFSFGVVYDTPIAKVQKIPEIVKKIIANIEHAKVGRVNFKAFGNSALEYEVVYFIDSNDYDLYMNIQQNINVEIKKAFEKEKIEMAFPTQTVYIKK